MFEIALCSAVVALLLRCDAIPSLKFWCSEASSESIVNITEANELLQLLQHHLLSLENSSNRTSRTDLLLLAPVVLAGLCDTSLMGVPIHISAPRGVIAVPQVSTERVGQPCMTTRMGCSGYRFPAVELTRYKRAKIDISQNTYSFIILYSVFITY